MSCKLSEVLSTVKETFSQSLPFLRTLSGFVAHFKRLLKNKKKEETDQQRINGNLRLLMDEGSDPCLSSCHSFPLAGRSKSHASSKSVIPRLKISAFMENLPLSTSGAKYFESPSTASHKFWSTFRYNSKLVSLD